MAPRLRLVVPCFDEERRLPVATFRADLARIPDVSLTFVDDGSTDRTAEILDGLAREAPSRVDVLHLPQNLGKGEAVRAGMLRALDEGASYVGYWDADLAAPLAAAFDLAAVLDANPDLVLVMGSRIRTLGNRIDRRAVRHYAGRIVATAISRTLDLPVYDTQCGAKVFRATPLVRGLFEEPFLTRWLFDVEILARLVRMNRRGSVPAPETLIREHPLARWSDVPGSKVRAREFVRSFFALRRIRRRYLRP